jgi:hypothetical protein
MRQYAANTCMPLFVGEGKKASSNSELAFLCFNIKSVDKWSILVDNQVDLGITPRRSLERLCGQILDIGDEYGRPHI